MLALQEKLSCYAIVSILGFYDVFDWLNLCIGILAFLLGGSRHASPGSEKSQDSSYSSGSFDCKSPPAQSSPTSVQTASTDHHNHGVVTSPNALSSSDTNCVNIGTVSNTVLAPSASSNASRRTKRKVKLVPYQDTTGNYCFQLSRDGANPKARMLVTAIA